MSEALVLKFSDDLSAFSVSAVGGKAFTLATLYEKKFSVPAGFVITTHAFDQYLQSLGQSDRANLAHVSGIQQRILFGDLSSHITEVVEHSLDMFNTSCVAVRSSATMEDGLGHSYAGQFESFLNVPKKNIFQQVKMCWGSLFNPRALAYSKNGINGGKMAVLVQEMIEADFSGVIFSVNPVDSDGNTVIIELIPGLGESLVQGVVNPDRYIVCKKSLVIQEKHIISNSSLLDGIIQKIVRIVMKIENFYQVPIDMEFAVKNEEVYVLQARPITAFSHN